LLQLHPLRKFSYFLGSFSVDEILLLLSLCFFLSKFSYHFFGIRGLLSILLLLGRMQLLHKLFRTQLRTTSKFDAQGQPPYIILVNILPHQINLFNHSFSPFSFRNIKELKRATFNALNHCLVHAENRFSDKCFNFLYRFFTQV
jgi:hypothetical protein